MARLWLTKYSRRDPRATRVSEQTGFSSMQGNIPPNISRPAPVVPNGSLPTEWNDSPRANPAPGGNTFQNYGTMNFNSNNTYGGPYSGPLDTGNTPLPPRSAKPSTIDNDPFPPPRRAGPFDIDNSPFPLPPRRVMPEPPLSDLDFSGGLPPGYPPIIDRTIDYTTCLRMYQNDQTPRRRVITPPRCCDEAWWMRRYGHLLEGMPIVFYDGPAHLRPPGTTYDYLVYDDPALAKLLISL